ncbi:XRE family transcriptional regulator [Paraflavitalea soli]|uniref:XRE family transcriptional regulator n=1 Tax=Paraflavitalea soli TaxID=2315862 RepID=A0A3B7N0T7_9BACT|nr:helix-turn-helix transcriptional regulator [Paraflavitalea soli]AXY77645.1 XRE family transcriptional regulator [Paraflavitalea soli]
MAKKVTKKTQSSLEDFQEDMLKIGNRLRELRKKAGFGAYDIFAYHIGMERSQYGRYERGQANFEIVSFLKILAGLQVSLKEFFAEGFN